MSLQTLKHLLHKIKRADRRGRKAVSAFLTIVQYTLGKNNKKVVPCWDRNSLWIAQFSLSGGREGSAGESESAPRRKCLLLFQLTTLNLGQPGHQLLGTFGIQIGEGLCPHAHQTIAQYFKRNAFHGGVEQRFCETTQVGEVPALRSILLPKQINMVLNGIEHQQALHIKDGCQFNGIGFL